MGEYRIVVPEGMELAAYRREASSGTLANGEPYEYEVWIYHYQLAPDGLQVVVEREQRWNLDGELTYTSVTGELVDASGQYLSSVRRYCACPGQYLSADLRVLATIYCHVKGESFDHPAKEVE